MKKQTHKIHGFTLMETMITISIISLIALFAIPNYNKSKSKSIERIVYTNLIAVHGACEIYKAKNGAYWDTAGTNVTNLDTINATLNTNIQPDSLVAYNYTTTDDTYCYIQAICSTCPNGQGGWGMFLDTNLGPINPGTNPQCGWGTCSLF